MLLTGDDQSNDEDEFPEVQRIVKQSVKAEAMHDFVTKVMDTVVQESKSSPSTLLSRANLSYVLNDFQGAERDYDEAIKLIKPDEPLAALALTGRAAIYFQEGRYEQALSLYHTAKLIEEKIFGSGHILVGQTLHNMAMTFLGLSQIQDAKDCITESIEIKRTHYANRPNEDLALSFTALGSILKAEGNIELAKLALEEAVKVSSEASGGNLGTDMVDTLLEIGNLAHSLGDLEDSLQVLTRACDILRSSLPVEPNLSLCLALQQSAQVAQQLGQTEAAVKLLLECLERAQTLEDDDSSLVANVRLALTLARIEESPVEDTLRELTVVVDGLRKDHSSEGKLNLALALHTTGAALVKQGKPSESMKAFEESLSIRKEILGDENELVGDSLTDIGYVFLILERFSEAESRLKQAILVYLRCFPSDDTSENPKLALCYFHLGNACYMLNKQIDAERNFRQALKQARKALGNEHQQVKSLEKMVEALVPSALV